MFNDTIAAVATAPGEAGIGIVRISGRDAFSVAGRLFRGKGAETFFDGPSHKAYYGGVHDPGDGERIDETLMLVMRGPETYTTEDVVEFNCHGGQQVLKRVLEAALSAGARPAEPGEFTRRAFLGGRLDLAQAEAVIDLIRAGSEQSRRLALNQLQGALSQTVAEQRRRLTAIRAEIEAAVDYGDRDIEPASSEELLQRAKAVAGALADLLATARQGRILREGLRVVIAGRPNVGKSSLLNALLREERAIVTEVPGTTRDLIEEQAQIDGVPVVVTDTAGIRPTEDRIERLGVEMSRKELARADLVLMLFDHVEALSGEDRALYEEVRTTDAVLILVLNKTDLDGALESETLKREFPGHPVVPLSALTGDGLEELERQILDRVVGKDALVREPTLVASARHRRALEEALAAVEDAAEALAGTVPVDLVAIDIKEGIDALGLITGETASDELLDEIFSRFCIGK